ncbi:hypothetical protein [Massilia sp. Root335]|uniref:hypothetical protein n=1 Tax=Massilia sp. Root335 TaxID=1736517 RepID=UPI0006F8387F|nr:hypothetical protein [Massilia sp. Root335]KQV37767.1 hypothetical protein ASC93_01365 [Massilia sp. Root335]
MLITTVRPGRRGPALGWGISLLVHALLAAWLLHAPPPRRDDGPATTRIDFVLVPARAVPPTSAPALAPATPTPAAPRRRRKMEPAMPRAAVASTTRAAPAAVAAPVTAAAPAAIVVPATAAAPTAVVVPATSTASDALAGTAAAAAPAPPDDASVFDMAAARGIARAAAREDGRGLVALPKRPPPTLDPGREAREDQLARGIARSSRNDCRTAYAGLGLLAVLPLLKDAVTGSGCKW